MNVCFHNNQNLATHAVAMCYVRESPRTKETGKTKQSKSITLYCKRHGPCLTSWFYNKNSNALQITCLLINAYATTQKHVQFYAIEYEGISHSWDGQQFVNYSFASNHIHWKFRAFSQVFLQLAHCTCEARVIHLTGSAFQ